MHLGSPYQLALSVGTFVTGSQYVVSLRRRPKQGAVIPWERQPKTISASWVVDIRIQAVPQHADTSPAAQPRPTSPFLATSSWHTTPLPWRASENLPAKFKDLVPLDHKKGWGKAKRRDVCWLVVITLLNQTPGDSAQSFQVVIQVITKQQASSPRYQLIIYPNLSAPLKLSQHPNLVLTLPLANPTNHQNETMPFFYSKPIGGRNFGTSVHADRHGVRRGPWRFRIGRFQCFR
ncbi:uncharacterized protein LY79DRAFT_576923 [Colletotrichum navitas]|uniref:Uncharacterized protein n=1 Tax=Colletotrichum navitas TaxID=681940 RepID=A0AAD8Q8K0_9PEZI|nr:uncharacterized protein LY79DRAFT_576923 [Colletotrichum navitas]KAK1597206.1 hypothetical protein LY79DRAFT_576923 [Colletotrichum navitas]